MRTDANRQEIVDNLIDPYAIEQFLTEEEIKELLELYHYSHKINKTTGPVTSVELRPQFDSNPVLVKLFDKIQKVIGPCKIFSAFFFYVERPHIIHTDDNIDLPVMYRGITLPLELQYTDDSGLYPDLCFFDQYYLEGGSKFFNGSKDIPTFYNKQVYEYSQVQNKNGKMVSEEVRKKYFPHLKHRWLDDLSFKSALPWKPGNALIFDSVRLHCASDFRTVGVKSKLGMSIFTYR